MNKKRDLVEKVLKMDMNASTYNVINKCMSIFGVSVSERTVQRIRKEIKKDMEIEKNHDVFDTSAENEMKNENVSINELKDSEVDLINLVNEGGWSIQQLAEHTTFTTNQIRELFGENGSLREYITTSDILDEENEKVFLNAKNNVAITRGAQEILDELDRIDLGGNVVGNVAGNVVNVNQKKDFWEVEQECVSSCGKIDKSIDVFMNYRSRKKAMLYMKWAGAREWLAYLIGFKKGKGYYVTDLFLPDQRTSATLVDKVEADNYNELKIIGVIHSHHEMGAGDAERPSFSGHDAAFINSNHNLSLLAGRDRETGGFKIVGIARNVTPCGAFVQVKANVKAFSDDPEEKGWKDEFVEKTMSAPPNTGYAGKGWNNGGYGWNGAKSNSSTSQTVINVNDKRTFKPDEDGIVRTRYAGFNFSK